MTQENTVRDLGVSGPTVLVMRDSSALEGHGPSVLAILVHLTTTMQQALLTAVMFHLNVFAQHGTRLQVEICFQ